jgi:hypothetical protein
VIRHNAASFPTGGTPLVRVNRRSFLLRVIGCLAVGLLVQFPIAWGIAYFNSPSWQGETSVIVLAPEGSTSNVERVRIENDTHFGVRWVQITGWSKAYTSDVNRSDEDALFTGEPTWPFPASEVFLGLRNPAAWPATVPSPSGYLTGNYGQTMVTACAIGWPFLCLTGRVDRDPVTNVWTTRGMFMLPEPKFRKWTLLGFVPICYQPRWTGIAANGTCFGGVLLVSSMGFARARDRWRLRRGLCRHCRYDLRGLAMGSVCPECGMGVVKV